MYRPTAAAFGALSSSQHVNIPNLLSKSYSRGPSAVPKTNQDVSPTKGWLAAEENRGETVPRNLINVKYSPGREKSKGGSANTKATVQIALHALSKEIPQEMIEDVKSLKSYVRSKDALEISSEQSTRQKQNLDICYRRLDDSLRQVATNRVAREEGEIKAASGPAHVMKDVSYREGHRMSDQQGKTLFARRRTIRKKPKQRH